MGRAMRTRGSIRRAVYAEDRGAPVRDRGTPRRYYTSSGGFSRARLGKVRIVSMYATAARLDCDGANGSCAGRVAARTESGSRFFLSLRKLRPVSVVLRRLSPPRCRLAGLRPRFAAAPANCLCDSSHAFCSSCAVASIPLLLPPHCPLFSVRAFRPSLFPCSRSVSSRRLRLRPSRRLAQSVRHFAASLFLSASLPSIGRGPRRCGKGLGDFLPYLTIRLRWLFRIRFLLSIFVVFATKRSVFRAKRASEGFRGPVFWL